MIFQICSISLIVNGGNNHGKGLVNSDDIVDYVFQYHLYINIYFAEGICGLTGCGSNLKSGCFLQASGIGIVMTSIGISCICGIYRMGVSQRYMNRLCIFIGDGKLENDPVTG